MKDYRDETNTFHNLALDCTVIEFPLSASNIPSAIPPNLVRVAWSVNESGNLVVAYGKTQEGKANE